MIFNEIENSLLICIKYINIMVESWRIPKILPHVINLLFYWDLGEFYSSLKVESWRVPLR